MRPCSSSEQWLPLGWPCHFERFVCQRNWDAYLERSGTLCSQISKDKTQAEHHQKVPPFLSGCRFPEESGLHWGVSIMQKKLLEQLCPRPISTPTDVSPTLLFHIAVNPNKKRQGLLHQLVWLNLLCPSENVSPKTDLCRGHQVFHSIST